MRNAYPGPDHRQTLIDSCPVITTNFKEISWQSHKPHRLNNFPNFVGGGNIHLYSPYTGRKKRKQNITELEKL